MRYGSTVNIFLYSATNLMPKRTSSPSLPPKKMIRSVLLSGATSSLSNHLHILSRKPPAQRSARSKPRPRIPPMLLGMPRSRLLIPKSGVTPQRPFLVLLGMASRMLLLPLSLPVCWRRKTRRRSAGRVMRISTASFPRRMARRRMAIS